MTSAIRIILASAITVLGTYTSEREFKRHPTDWSAMALSLAAVCCGAEMLITLLGNS